MVSAMGPVLTARPPKPYKAVVSLHPCRRHTDITSVTHNLTGKVTPQCVANHRAQLFPRPSLKYHQYHPHPAIFGNVMVNTPTLGFASEKPSSQNNSKRHPGWGQLLLPWCCWYKRGPRGLPSCPWGLRKWVKGFHWTPLHPNITHSPVSLAPFWAGPQDIREQSWMGTSGLGLWPQLWHGLCMWPEADT